MTKISEEQANKTRLIHQIAQRSQGDSPPAPPPRQGDMADLVNWTMKNVLLSLIPFLVGALIRWLENGIGWRVFNPVQLTFALGMFCLFVYVSAGNLDNLKYKDTIRTTYLSGIVLFIALFSVATFLDSQLSGIHNRTIDRLIEAAEAEKLLSKEMINQHAQLDVIHYINNINQIIIAISLFCSIMVVVIGVRLRYLYGIGDEK